MSGYCNGNRIIFYLLGNPSPPKNLNFQYTFNPHNFLCLANIRTFLGFNHDSKLSKSKIGEADYELRSGILTTNTITEYLTYTYR